jgi:hypothetical protein
MLNLTQAIAESSSVASYGATGSEAASGDFTHMPMVICCSFISCDIFAGRAALGTTFFNKLRERLI